MVTTHIAQGSERALNRWLGVCDRCIRPVSVEDTNSTSDFRTTTCPECGGTVTVERLYGVRTEMTCDPRCEGAIGRYCECACGGVNHGGVWFRNDETTATALAKYRKLVADRRAKAEQRRQSKADRVAAQREIDRQFWLDDADHRQVITWLSANRQRGNFLTSLAEQFDQSGHLSERQVDAIRRNMVSEAHKPTAEAKPAPIGTDVVVEGTISEVNGDYGPYGYVTKLVVNGDDGWRIKVTAPKNLLSQVGGHEDRLIGHRVRFTAGEVKAGRNPVWGFASRPRNAVLVDVDPDKVVLNTTFGRSA